MWLYYNSSRQENTICPHGQVARQQDGFDIILALDSGTLVNQGYSTVSLYYQRNDQNSPVLFRTLSVDSSYVQSLTFHKINDSEITYGLVDGKKYDTIRFEIQPEDDIVLRKGDLKIQFWRTTTSEPNAILFSKTNLYLEQSLSYFDTVSNRITKSEAKKILENIERGMYIVTGSWAKSATFNASNFSLNMASSHGVTTIYGNFTATSSVTGPVLVATATAANRTLPASSVVHCLKSDGTVINGKVVENGSNLEFWIDGNLSTNDVVSVNGVLYIQFGDILDETTLAQYPYINRNGDDNLAGDFVPLNDSESALGSNTKRFSNIYVDAINGVSTDIFRKVYRHEVKVTTGDDYYIVTLINSSPIAISTLPVINLQRKNIIRTLVYLDTPEESFDIPYNQLAINDSSIGGVYYILSTTSPYITTGSISTAASDITSIVDTVVEI